MNNQELIEILKKDNYTDEDIENINEICEENDIYYDVIIRYIPLFKNIELINMMKVYIFIFQILEKMTNYICCINF